MDDKTKRAAEARSQCPYLNAEQAAHYLGISSRTLQRMRTDGVGPLYRKHGGIVRYHIEELERWSVNHSPQSTIPNPAVYRGISRG